MSEQKKYSVGKTFAEGGKNGTWNVILLTVILDHLPETMDVATRNLIILAVTWLLGSLKNWLKNFAFPYLENKWSWTVAFTGQIKKAL